MLITELKTLAKSLNVAGYSKLRKAELIIAIGDACYDEAVTENRKRVTRKIAAGYKRKSYTERMLNRVHGYQQQNGCARMTPAQRRRLDKKYNRQYGKLVADLAK